MAQRFSGSRKEPAAVVSNHTLDTSSQITDGKLPAGTPPGLAHNIWGQEAQTQKYPALTEDATADVVVIGAGITGLSIALNLVKNGKSVLVVEGRTRGSGQTGRSSGMLQQWDDDGFTLLEKKYGEGAARKVAHAHQAAINFHEQMIKEESIECDFVRLPGYMFPHETSKELVQKLDYELSATRRAGMEVNKVDLDGAASMGGIHTALEFPSCAELHPLKYINGLAEAVVKHGGRVYEMTRMRDDFTPIMRGKVPLSTGAHAIAREAIVLATHQPISRNPLAHSRQLAYRTYMVGLKIPKGSVTRASFWDTQAPYHYVRVVPMAGHDVLLVGGEHHKSGFKVHEYYDAYERLESWARERWSMAGDVLWRWSGQNIVPIDKMFLIGLEPYNPLNLVESAKRYIATGDSGQDMISSGVAALLLTDQILGRSSEFKDVFDPARIIPLLKNPGDLYKEGKTLVSSVLASLLLRNVNDVKGLVRPSSVEDIAPGTGAVVQEGLYKVAIYKDVDGKINRRLAVCPHLGCLVEYNPIESTFDCPCHGSIYTKEGVCIHGPSASDLKELW